MNELNPELSAQIAEAAERGKPVADVKIKTKTVQWRGKPWQVRAKPGAAFLAHYEDDRMMSAVRSIVGAEQYAAILELDPDIEGRDGVEGFIAACNVAWGITSGN